MAPNRSAAISFIFITLLIDVNYNSELEQLYPLFIGSLILLIVGVIDDKINVKAIIKLIIHFAYDTQRLKYSSFSSSM